MMSQQELFAGTNFSHNLQKAIYTDISQLVRIFPSINPYRSKIKSEVKILIQGSLTICINGEKSSMPINIMLPDCFPSCCPIVQIPQTPGKIIIPSNVLMNNGCVLVEQIYNWVPCKSILPDLIFTIIRYFGMNPPFQQQSTASIKTHAHHHNALKPKNHIYDKNISSSGKNETHLSGKELVNKSQETQTSLINNKKLPSPSNSEKVVLASNNSMMINSVERKL